MNREHVVKLALKEIGEMLDLEEEMVNLEPLETPVPLDPPDRPDSEETLLLKWLEDLMRRLEALRWV